MEYLVSDGSKRIQQQLVIALLSAAMTTGIFLLVESKDATFRWSMASGYAALALIGLSLIIGPINVLRGRTNPLNIRLRRDIGIWGGVLGLVHTVAGLQVHMGGLFWLYFVFPPEENHLIPILRYDLFGLANYTGLGVTIILFLLLSLSNNAMLKNLGPQQWKKWQRLNYTGYSLLIVHGAAYQWLEKRTAGFILAFVIQVAFVGTLQATGYRLMLQKKRSKI